MNEKLIRIPTAAVIDIGSNELRLHIGQATPEGEREGVTYLESLHYPISLGRDTFHGGKMRFDKVDKACEVIRNYIKAARSYGVRAIRTVANTVAREATNIDYILDQIKIKTGVDVEVMDEAEEKRHIYRLMTQHATDEVKENALLVYIGSGNVGVALMQENRMTHTWNIPVGSLRIGEMFGELQDFSRDFHRLLEEYLASFTQQVAKEIPEGIKHFIVSGQEIDIITRLCGVSISAPLFALSREMLEELCGKIKRKSPERIADEFHLPMERADALLPAASIYQNLLALTKAETLTVSQLLPCDAVLFEMLHPKRYAQLNKRLSRSTDKSVNMLARRYQVNIAHGEHVRQMGLAIFDKLKKLHGLGARDKLLLSAAAMLHEVGEFINVRAHHFHSYNIINASDIVGLSATEIEIVALICRYHADLLPGEYDECYTALTREEKVRVSKLVALLRLADAMDRSYTQKFSDVDAKLVGTELTISVTTHRSASLEQWAFDEKGQFFSEVFGLKAQLKVRKV